jgi:hypothetical protein
VATRDRTIAVGRHVAYYYYCTGQAPLCVDDDEMFRVGLIVGLDQHKRTVTVFPYRSSLRRRHNINNRRTIWKRAARSARDRPVVRLVNVIDSFKLTLQGQIPKQSKKFIAGKLRSRGRAIETDDEDEEVPHEGYGVVDLDEDVYDRDKRGMGFEGKAGYEAESDSAARASPPSSSSSASSSSSSSSSCSSSSSSSSSSVSGPSIVDWSSLKKDTFVAYWPQERHEEKKAWEQDEVFRIGKVVSCDQKDDSVILHYYTCGARAVTTFKTTKYSRWTGKDPLVTCPRHLVFYASDDDILNAKSKTLKAGKYRSLMGLVQQVKGYESIQ